MEQREQHSSLVKRSTPIYLAMVIFGLIASKYLHKNLSEIFSLPTSTEEWQNLICVTALGSGIIAITHQFGRLSSSYPSYKKWVAELLGPLSFPTAVYLAVISSLGEELFFRVSMQPYVGVLWTSILLAILQLTPQGFMPIWLLIGLINNLTVGFIYHYTGSLLPPLLIHLVITSTSFLSHAYRSRNFSNPNLRKQNDRSL